MGSILQFGSNFKRKLKLTMIHKQIQDICLYIQMDNQSHQGFEKILKQPQRHRQPVWELILKLSWKLKNANIQKAFKNMEFMLEDGPKNQKKHQTSKKWLMQFMVVHDIAKKIGSQFVIKDFLKPQKEKIIPFIHKLIEVIKAIQKISQSADQMVIQDHYLGKQLVKHQTIQGQTANQLYQLRQRKKEQLPIYQQKVITCQKVKQQISYKRNQKLDITASLAPLNNQIRQKQKQLQTIQSQYHNKQMQIQRLKTQITNNAPQVKKQQKAVQAEYNRLSKQCQNQLLHQKNKHQKMNQLLQNRIQYQNQILDKFVRIVQIFGQNQQLTTKQLNAKNQNQNLIKKLRQVNIKHNQTKENGRNILIQINSHDSTYETQKHNYFQNQILCHKKNNILQQINQNYFIIYEKQQRILQYFQKITNQIQQINLQIALTTQQMDEECSQLNGKITSYIEEVFDPFHNYASAQGMEEQFDDTDYLMQD